MFRQNEHKENSNCQKNSNNNGNIGLVDGDRKSNNVELGGWNFVDSLSHKSYNFKEVNETEKVYIHPLDKCSVSTLSKKSLEMCTESLGSETGSDISESIEEFSSPSWGGENFHGIQRSKFREYSKKLNQIGSFPPPLTSIRGSDGVKVRSHRADGRLVIKAVTVSSSNPYFRAERDNGRLRLSLLKDNSIDSDNEAVENKETEDNEENDDESDGDYDVKGEDDDHGGYRGEDMEGNGGNFGGEDGFGELPRPSRCKEGGGENKGMSAWGPFWVATS